MTRRTLRRSTRFAVISAVAAGALAAGSLAAQAAESGDIRGLDESGRVADRYVVVFDTEAVSARGVGDTARDLAREHGGEVEYTYDTALRGFSVTMDESHARALATERAVEYVEAVGMATVSGEQANPPSWGQDRVDQADLPLDDSYTYPDSAGEGVSAYILDTGIRMTHNDFGGRATSGYDFIDDDDDATDCQGHGTHVSGTVGGTEHGLAKNANLVGVRVLDCAGSGPWDVVIAGIDWVADNAAKPAVANMSLAGGTQDSVNQAVDGAIGSGVQFAIAAGNNSGDACSYSPASTEAAVTVGATDENDGQASFSNYGDCLDIYAPGNNITSSTNNGDDTSGQMSGTSMAAPHVAGAMALYLAANPDSSPQQTRDAIVDNGASGKVSNPGPGSPNVLLNTEFLNS